MAHEQTVVKLTLFFAARKRTRRAKSADSTSSRISVDYINLVIERLKAQKNRKSTTDTYHRIWKHFNKFLLRLDRKPKFWEDRVQLFCAYLIDNGTTQSSTIKTYISAIKSVLKNDGYEWDDNRIMFNTLTKACKLTNDRVKCRQPIRIGLLEQLLFEIDRHWGGTQPYLQTMFKTLFSLGYYGLMRVGELTYSEHTLKAKNVYIGQNKEKILLVLYSSKTHGKESEPQEIKITSVQQGKMHRKRHFCPFKLTEQYMAMRDGYRIPGENFFVFSDGEPVMAHHMRELLRTLLRKLNLEAEFFDTHSFRIGRSSDLLKAGLTIEQIKHLGRWKSNAVYRYLKAC